MDTQEQQKLKRAAYRHGLRTSAMPRGFAWLAREVGTFRRSLEKAVAEKHGEVDVRSATLISAAVRGEQLARLAARWLAVEESILSIQERTKLLREINVASAARDRAVASLNLELTPAEQTRRRFARQRAAAERAASQQPKVDN
jgi:hypothetical protein